MIGSESLGITIAPNLWQYWGATNSVCLIHSITVNHLLSTARKEKTTYGNFRRNQKGTLSASWRAMWMHDDKLWPQ